MLDGGIVQRNSSEVSSHKRELWRRLQLILTLSGHKSPLSFVLFIADLILKMFNRYLELYLSMWIASRNNLHPCYCAVIISWHKSSKNMSLREGANVLG